MKNFNNEVFIIRKGKYNRWYVDSPMYLSRTPMAVIPGAVLDTFGTKQQAREAARKLNTRLES